MLTDLHGATAENTAPDAGSDLQVTAELRVLTGSCGLYPLDDRSKLLVTGEDRTRWLNGMITNNIRDLAPGRGVYAFLLNAQGRIQADLYAFHRSKDVILEVDRAQAENLLAILDRYIVMDDVQIEPMDDRLTALGVQGPGAAAILRRVKIELPELEPLQLAELTWHDVPITILRAEGWKGEAYEIWLAPEHRPSLQQALVQAGAVAVGTAALRLYRIASGIPRFGEDIRERDLPQETGQDRALHFTKGCYVGQEIVERIRSRGQVHRVFAGFDLTIPCAPGDPIETRTDTETKTVGEITSTAAFPSPTGDRHIALGYLRREAFGKPLSSNGAPVIQHELPFQELLQP